jgi:hypothetical protein
LSDAKEIESTSFIMKHVWYLKLLVNSLI